MDMGNWVLAHSSTCEVTCLFSVDFETNNYVQASLQVAPKPLKKKQEMLVF